MNKKQRRIIAMLLVVGIMINAVLIWQKYAWRMSLSRIPISPISEFWYLGYTFGYLAGIAICLQFVIVAIVSFFGGKRSLKSTLLYKAFKIGYETFIKKEKKA